MEIRNIEQWRVPASIGTAYARLLHAAGDDRLGPALHGALTATTAGVRRLYLFETTGRRASTLTYCCCEPEVVPLLPLYMGTYRDIDPLCQAYTAATRAGELTLQRIRPGDIASPSFRRLFFDEPGIAERVSLVQRVAGGWRGMNVARHVTDGTFGDGDLDTVVALAWLALPMLALTRPPRPFVASVLEFEQRYRDLCPGLSRRERQVCARAAVGMTVEAAAIDLGVAETSVRTYRKRAYARLGVASALELLALVTQ